MTEVQMDEDEERCPHIARRQTNVSEWDLIVRVALSLANWTFQISKCIQCAMILHLSTPIVMFCL